MLQFLYGIFNPCGGQECIINQPPVPKMICEMADYFFFTLRGGGHFMGGLKCSKGLFLMFRGNALSPPSGWLNVSKVDAEVYFRCPSKTSEQTNTMQYKN